LVPGSDTYKLKIFQSIFEKAAISVYSDHSLLFGNLIF